MTPIPESNESHCAESHRLKLQLKEKDEEIERLQKSMTKDNLSGFYDWELSRHATEYEVEFRGNEIKILQSRIKVLTEALKYVKTEWAGVFDPKNDSLFHESVSNSYKTLRDKVNQALQSGGKG